MGEWTISLAHICPVACLPCVNLHKTDCFESIILQIRLFCDEIRVDYLCTKRKSRKRYNDFFNQRFLYNSQYFNKLKGNLILLFLCLLVYINHSTCCSTKIDKEKHPL